jgi:hypothetical protein
VAFDNEPSDQDGDAENYDLVFVSVLLRFCCCPVASKTSSTEYEDEGHFDPKPRGRHHLNKNLDATHFIHVLCAIFFGQSAEAMQEARTRLRCDAINQHECVIGMLADMFGADNSQFKRERFTNACQPGANVRARS